jgi:hypothetical protein
MKQFLFIITLAFTFNLNAQISEEAKVKSKIIEFFDAFHKQDSTSLRSMVTDDITLQSIFANKEGETILKISEFDAFVTSIASIPKDKKFEEKLTDFSIQVDGEMANAWTSYEFWYDGSFSHCGVNSFQLMKQGDEWKIIYLVDTRRQSDCNK